MHFYLQMLPQGSNLAQSYFSDPTTFRGQGLINKLTIFVLKSSTQAKAEDGGLSAKSNIKNKGSYSCAS
jgi:hypothetical protein